jgi:UDP-glucose 4-epimerase
MRLLVTGGAGYVGSHTSVALLQAGHDVVIVDNLCNSKETAIRRVCELAGRPVGFHRVDVLDPEALDRVFERERVDAVLHFAGLKAVGESVAQPLPYYRNNVTGAVHLCEAMARHGIRTIVFSSSATVYGEPAAVPVRETFPLAPVNPYGRTKVMIEDILRDLHRADSEWRVAILRYFNPVGAHPSGRIGEDPSGTPNNLLPYLAQVAVGRLSEVPVYGNDYPTPDGTGLRDYIHVMDLAAGHERALAYLERNPGVMVCNLGTGRPYSVLQVIAAFERASGRSIRYRIVPRRSGDVAASWADPTLAERELGWKAERDLDQMCLDGWRWQSANPGGYPDDGPR